MPDKMKTLREVFEKMDQAKLSLPKFDPEFNDILNECTKDWIRFALGAAREATRVPWYEGKQYREREDDAWKVFMGEDNK